MSQTTTDYQVTIDMVGEHVDNRRLIGRLLKDLATDVRGLGSVELEGFDPEYHPGTLVIRTEDGGVVDASLRRADRGTAETIYAFQVSAEGTLEGRARDMVRNLLDTLGHLSYAPGTRYYRIGGMSLRQEPA